MAEREGDEWNRLILECSWPFFSFSPSGTSDRVRSPLCSYAQAHAPSLAFLVWCISTSLSFVVYFTLFYQQPLSHVLSPCISSHGIDSLQCIHTFTPHHSPCLKISCLTCTHLTTASLDPGNDKHHVWARNGCCARRGPPPLMEVRWNCLCGSQQA